MNRKADVVVVGAGIAGLAHAWAAARYGRSVILIERSAYAQGASIRNFGMVWPIGQCPGKPLRTAMRSRALWFQAAQEAGFWHKPSGSIFLATREDELQVMREFVDQSDDLGYDCTMLNQAGAWDQCPAANRDHVIGGFYSDTELGVDPRQAIATMPKMLAERYGVEIHFETSVRSCTPGAVQTGDGTTFEAGERVVVCSGAETNLLFPSVLDHPDLLPCKLQMLATEAQPDGWRTGPMIASGSTLRHYQSFEACPSLDQLKQRFANEQPELDAFGIHFMAAQNGLGEVVLGDSHEYGKDIGPFNSQQVESLLLQGLQELLDLPDFKIARRWHGVYLKTLGRTHFVDHPLPGVTVFNGLGGAGMTLSFGLADQMWAGSSPTILVKEPTTQHGSTNPQPSP